MFQGIQRLNSGHVDNFRFSKSGLEMIPLSPCAIFLIAFCAPAPLFPHPRGPYSKTNTALERINPSWFGDGLYKAPSSRIKYPFGATGHVTFFLSASKSLASFGNLIPLASASCIIRSKSRLSCGDKGLLVRIILLGRQSPIPLHPIPFVQHQTLFEFVP